ncbi:hypothetical protein RhiirC2_791875 [Rhizophagus irregularis]|uniref:Uncharacterized protein n=1 Tax=Rhizophagus irregularis TaxID=588596 RepID=A0A2N1MIC7_9GLOM|nr:hypothetical protein RhiirC2_791875 [Rhizophagus irregularis]
MDEDMGKGLIMKRQEELIGKDGIYKKRTGINRFNVFAHTTSEGDKFVDAYESPLSMIPKSKEEHEELDDLNSKFIEHLDKLEKKKEDVTIEGSMSAEKEEKEDKEDKFNNSKKHAVAIQG